MKRFIAMLLVVLMIFTPVKVEAAPRRLTKRLGVFYNKAGFKETYYNLNMKLVVKYMRDLGYDSDEYPYWETEDGMKMLGDYIMVAAHLDYYPKGTIVETSWGKGIVCDTGYLKSNQLDIAVTW